MKSRCKQCHTTFVVGVNGLSDGRCDNCAGVQRDSKGYAWFFWEKSHMYQDVETGEIETVNRVDAFRR